MFDEMLSQISEKHEQNSYDTGVTKRCCRPRGAPRVLINPEDSVLRQVRPMRSIHFSDEAHNENFVSGD